MIISDTYRFVFVKTRKTAGSTVERLIRPFLSGTDICTGSTRDKTMALNVPIDTNGHLTYSEIIKKYPSTKEYAFISLERNPWEKVISSYHWHQLIKPKQFSEMPFETYMKSCNMLPTDWDHYTEGDEVMCSIFFTENLYDFFKTMSWYSMQYGNNIYVTKDQVKNTRVKEDKCPLKVVHTEETDNIVRQLFAKEIDKFGFEKP